MLELTQLFRQRLVEAQHERIAQASALLMQLESPIESVLAAAKIAHQNKTMVALNPAPARELSDELLALVDIITPNETEAEKLTGSGLKMMKTRPKRRRHCMLKESILY